jgi:hypothetical protein
MNCCQIPRLASAGSESGVVRLGRIPDQQPGLPANHTPRPQSQLAETGKVGGAAAADWPATLPNWSVCISFLAHGQSFAALRWSPGNDMLVIVCRCQLTTVCDDDDTTRLIRHIFRPENSRYRLARRIRHPTAHPNPCHRSMQPSVVCQRQRLTRMCAF